MQEKPYCYITYPLPMEALAHLQIPFGAQKEAQRQEDEDFRPQWYLNASFPEDEE